MQKIEFGSTGLVIEKNGFGCLPIQRISETEAVKLLHKACDGGINFFDTARAYSDSEQKVGAAFSAMRGKIVLFYVDFADRRPHRKGHKSRVIQHAAHLAQGLWRQVTGVFAVDVARF